MNVCDVVGKSNLKKKKILEKSSISWASSSKVNRRYYLYHTSDHYHGQACPELAIRGQNVTAKQLAAECFVQQCVWDCTVHKQDLQLQGYSHVHLMWS